LDPVRWVPALRLDAINTLYVHHPIAFDLAVALPLSVGFAFLWNRPARVADVRAWARGAADPAPADVAAARRDARRAAAWSTLWIALLVVAQNSPTAIDFGLNVVLLVPAI